MRPVHGSKKLQWALHINELMHVFEITKIILN